MKLIESGRIKDKAELKKQFRFFVLKLHPDVNKSENAESSFLRLSSDYQEALQYFIKEKKDFSQNNSSSSVVSREVLYLAFGDITASGFPVDVSIRSSSKIYIKRIMAFSHMIANIQVLDQYSFLDVEKELYKIRGDNIIDNELFGKIRLIFYNIIPWHLEPKKITKLAIEKWYSEIKEELLSKNYKALDLFLKWLVDDLKNGSALSE